MTIKTKPLFLAIAISFALANHAVAVQGPVLAGTTVDNETLTNEQLTLKGTANRTTILSGSELTNNGGTDNNTLVKSGGFLRVSTNSSIIGQSISNNATIESGGQAAIIGDAHADGWVINGPAGAIDTVVMWSDTTTISNSTVNGGGFNIHHGTATNIVVNGGRMYTSGSDINTIVNNGGKYEIGGSSYGPNPTSSNLTVNTGANAIIGKSIITDVTVSGGMIVVPESSTLQGNISVNKGGELTIQGTGVKSTLSPTLKDNVSINDGGKITFTDGINSENAKVQVFGAGSLYLGGNASVATPNDYSLGSMAMNGGNVYFDQVSGGAPPVGYSSLTLASLDGNGSFYMNTELASKLGDFLTVKGQANGNFDIHIADTGVSPTSNSSLQIIQTGGGNAGFTLANKGHVVDVGTYQYQLIADGKGGWALTPAKQTIPASVLTPAKQVIPASVLTPAKQVIPASVLTPAKQVIPATVLTPSTPAKQSVPVTVLTPATQIAPVELPPEQKPGALMITPSTAAVLSMATVDPLIFQTELGSVRSRLDQVRSFSHETNVWGHYTTSHSNVEDAAGAGYGMNVNGVTIGADKSNEATNSVTTLGALFSYSHSDVDFDRGGDGNVDSYSAGVYTSYLHNSGFYFDGVLKANHFGNEINGRMTSGAAAHGDYNTTGIGAHLQGGKYFYFGQSFIAPYASVTGFTSNSSDFSLSNGMKGHTDPQRSVTGETGISLGHKFVVHGAQVQPYLKVAVTQEFIDDNTVKVNEDHFTNDVSGTRGAYQLGVDTKVTDRLTVHADAGYTQGRHIEAPWTANLGASWSF